MTGLRFRGWKVWAVFLTVVAVTLICGWDYFCIAARLAKFSTFSNPDGHDQVQLAQYSPRQLALFLRAPVSSWRLTVAQVLADHQTRHSAADWRGVAVGLARVAATDPDSEAGNFAYNVLQLTPRLSSSEGRRILSIAQSAVPGRRRCKLVRFVDESVAEISNEVDRLLQLWGDSEKIEDRRDAVALGTLLRADDPRWANLLIDLLDAEAALTPELVEAGQRVLGGKPELYSELLRGSRAAQSLALSSLRWSDVPDALYADVESAAAEFLCSVDPRLARICQQVLTKTQNGRRVLTEKLQDLRSSDQRNILKRLIRQVNRSRGSSDSVRFDTPQTEEIMQLLDSPAADVRHEAAKLLTYGIVLIDDSPIRSTRVIDPNDGRNPFPIGFGPRDPHEHERFYDLLSDATGSTDVLGLAYACAVSPPLEEDVYLIHAAVRRACVEHVTNTSRVTLDAFQLLLHRFPAHPLTSRLAIDVAFTAESFDDPHGRVSRRFLRRYGRGRYLPALVARYRVESGASKNALYALPLVFHAFRREPTLADKKCWEKLFGDCLSYYSLNPAPLVGRGRSLLPMSGVTARLESDVVRSGLERFAWKHLSSRDYRPLVDSWSQLSRLSGYHTVLAQQVDRALTSPHSSLRLNALTVLTRLPNQLRELDPLIGQQLCHHDLTVKVAAAMAIGTRRISGDDVVDRLLLYTGQLYGTRLRAACMRAIMQIDPTRACRLAEEYHDDQNVCLRTLSQICLKNQAR